MIHMRQLSRVIHTTYCINDTVVEVYFTGIFEDDISITYSRVLPVFILFA